MVLSVMLTGAMYVGYDSESLIVTFVFTEVKITLSGHIRVVMQSCVLTCTCAFGLHIRIHVVYALLFGMCKCVT